MKTQSQRMGYVAIIALLITGVFTVPAMAVDGVKLIDHAKVLAGGVTPGDTPGYPATISQPGSYRLSSNLSQPNANTTVIEITTSHVTLDLNGFAILGSFDCPGGVPFCAGVGDGDGITTHATQFNITIRNGTIQGMGRDGIRLFGDAHLIEYIHVRSNGQSGIQIVSVTDGTSMAQHNTAQRNVGTGILLTRGRVSQNVVSVNGAFGIFLVAGTVSYNVVTSNGFGLVLGSEVNYFGNALNGNTTNVSGPGGVNQGQNICGTVACPGAQF